MHLPLQKGKNRIARGIRTAVRASQISNSPHFKVGAVVMSGGRILSTGWNWYKKTHPRSRAHLRTLHAELHALQGLTREQLEGAVMFVARVTIGGLARMSKPCPGCQELLAGTPIKTVYYTNGTGKIEKMCV